MQGNMKIELKDLYVLASTSTLPLGLVACTEVLKDKGKLSAPAARKFLHIATGLVFMLTWPLYSPEPSARYIAALLPFLMAVRFILAGLGITSEPRLVAGTSRSGRHEELLAGPTLYGLVHAALTVVCWRSNPAGAAGLAALCAGDGLAEVAGRVWGSTGPLAGWRLPHNNNKTWAGSLGCLMGGFSTTLFYLMWFSHLGLFPGRLSMQEAMICAVASSLAATTVETLPGPDNLTVPAAAAFVASWWAP